MKLERRDFLRLSGLAALAPGLPLLAQVQAPPVSPATAPRDHPADMRADYTIRIARSNIELAPDHVISTTTYNGQFPGPLLRFKQGRSVVVDIHNDTETAEQLHWHGQTVPVEVDGAAEEGTPYIPAHGMRRMSFAPGPSGLRFYHTHLTPGGDLENGLYSGQAGPIYIEPKREAGRYDREIFLVLKEFQPAFSRGGDMPSDFLAN